VYYITAGRRYIRSVTVSAGSDVVVIVQVARLQDDEVWSISRHPAAETSTRTDWTLADDDAVGGRRSRYTVSANLEQLRVNLNACHVTRGSATILCGRKQSK